MEDINSGNPDLDQQLRNWLEWDLKGSESFLKIQKMIKDQEWSQLDKVMTKVSHILGLYNHQLTGTMTALLVLIETCMNLSVGIPFGWSTFRPETDKN